jgi:membrane fusion protein (multidrug efflux system)
LRRSRSFAVIVASIVLWPLPALFAQDPGVIVAEVTRLEFPLRVEALGTARANESVEIRPKINETVTAIRFDEGQQVKAGAVLIELEAREAKAAVASAKAAVLDSESKFVRGKGLFESDLISESELESLEAKRDADRAALDAEQARLSNTVVRAPFSGRVGLRRVSLGALVGPSTVITTLDDTDTIKLDFDVPETALAQVEKGLPVIAHSAAWRDEEFRGTVASIDTRIDPVSRTIRVRARIPNQKRLLRPGMFLTVDLLRENVTALMIPEHAIVPEQSRQFVFVIDEDKSVEKREIRTGRRRPGLVEVVEGLVEKEVIIVEGTQKVRPGSTVEIIRQIEVTP